MAFDVQAALKAGYSEGEIAEYLGQQQKFDAVAAMNSGYTPREIIKHLTTEPKAAPFSLADVGLTGAAGAVGATRAVLQAFGPETPGVETLGEFQQSLLGMRTPERQAEVARRAALEQQAAKSGSAVEEIGAFLGGIKEAPIQSIAQGVGSTVPALLTGAAALVVGAPLGIAAAVGIGARFLFGALQGAGEVKGSIYDNVFRELKAQGMPEDQAKIQAEAAQDYIGKNTDNIFVGAGLGALAGGTGAERVLGNYVAKKIGVDLAAGAAKKEAEGLIMRGVKEALKEGIPEGLQGGQEQFASNVALAREGFDVPEFEGVLGSAARDAAIGALTGGVVSPFGRQRAEAPIPEAERPLEKLGTEQLTALRDQYVEAETELSRLAEAAKAPDLTPEQKTAAVNAFIDYKNNTFAPLRAEFSRYRTQIEALTPKAEQPTIEPGVEPTAEPAVEPSKPVAPITPTTPMDEAGLRDLNNRYQEAKKQLNVLKAATKVRDLTPDERQAAIDAYKNFKINTFNPIQQEYGKNRQAILTLPKVSTLTPPQRPIPPTEPTIDQPSGEPPRDTNEPPPVGEGPKSSEPPAAPVEPLTGLPKPPETRDFQIAKPKEQIAKEVQGMTIPELARWAVLNAPNTPAQQFALKAFERINQYADRGIFPGKINVMNAGKRNTSGVRGAVGYRFYTTADRKPLVSSGFDISLRLNGIDEQGRADDLTGTRYSTILHELLHAATHLQIDLDPNSKPVKELNNLFNRVKAQVQVDIKKGVQNPALDAIRRGANTMKNVHELVSWGLTDKNFQDYLATIKVGEKTAFSKFVEIMRKLLNVNPEFESALDSLMRSSENLLSTPVKKIERGAGAPIKGAGIVAGEPAKRVELPKPPKPPKPPEGEEPPAPPPKPPEGEEPPAPGGIKLEPGKPFTRPKLPPLGPKPPELDISNVRLSKKPPEQGGRDPQVQAAAMLLAEGKMTREEYEKYVDHYRAIYPINIDALLPPSTVEAMRGALRGDVAKARLNTAIKDGTRVGLRMDLPALDKGVPVVSIHEGRPNADKKGRPYRSAGDVISYASTGYIKNVFFAPRDQDLSLKMGYMPEGKNPLQTAEGEWVNMTPEDVYKRVKELKNDPAWVQVGFDPHRHGYFYDRKTREPVVKADELFQVGNFLLAKNVKYAPKEEFLYETAERAPRVETPAFKKWFGDSKIVDEDGNPLVVYHGTKREFNVFETKYPDGLFFFSVNPSFASKWPVGSGGKGDLREPPPGTEQEYNRIKKVEERLYSQYMKPSDDYDLNTKEGRDQFDSDRAALKAAVKKETGFSSAIEFEMNAGVRVMPVYLSIQKPFDPRKDFTKIEPFLAKAGKQSLIDAGYHKSGNWVIYEDKGVIDELKRQGYDGIWLAENIGGPHETIAAFSNKQIKSATGNIGTFGPTEVITEENVGSQAVDIINKLGTGVQPPGPTAFQRGKENIKNAFENPKMTVESARKATSNFLDKFETATFSSSAAFDNQLRRAVAGDIKDNAEVIGMLIDASQSQAVHADALASQFIIEGGINYDPEVKKWVAYKEPDNFVELGKQTAAIAKKYDISEDEARRIAHTYFMSKRLKSLVERNAKDKERIEELKAERDVAETKAEKEKINREIERLKDREAYIHKDEPEIELGLSLGEMMPELKGVAKTWNGIRNNVRRVMVNSGLWTEEYADQMLDVIDYVPFYREEQLEEGKGPREFVRGLQVAAKEHRFKGTDKPVNDILDNMVRWTQYAVNRAVRNDKSVRMIDAALNIEMIDGTKMAERVTEAKRGMNIVRIWRDGEQELYNMADPLFAQAFTGIQSVAIEPITWFSKIANTLRDSIVLFPLFSVAQVPQDSFAAVFSSGLQPQYALRIPILAVKEFIRTLSKTSQTHEMLKKYGAVGVRDFNSTVIRDDAEIFAGLKATPGVKGKIKEALQHIAMSADNAVRQAVYEASIQQGLSKAEAMEKAFEIINFRRRGTNKMLQLAGQTIPFFYAYLAAQRVAYNTLTMTGISPQDRMAGLKTFAYTTASVMTLSLLYSMMNADDEDYKKTPAAIRDRMLMIPGAGGVGIPLRTDMFLFPKIIAEHTYLLLTQKGYEDPAKFRKSLASALGDALLSPTLVPQAIKPAVEMAFNYDFFQQRPILGQFEKQKEWSRQFNENTSELSKLFGKTGYVSPIMMDHFVRGFFGTTGGLALWFTNEAINKSNLLGVQPPEKTWREAVEAFPGTGSFLVKSNASALRTDFYDLRDRVNEAAATFADIKQRNPDAIKEFVEDEKRMAKLVVSKQVENVNKRLAQLRTQMDRIREIPSNRMSAAEKAEAIRNLKEVEETILKAINVPGMRERAKI